MPISLVYGSAHIEALEQYGSFFLIHGGAGPQDPKGPHAERAGEHIKDITQTIQPLVRRDKDLSNFESVLNLPFPMHDIPGRSVLTALSCAKLLEDDPLFNAGLGAALQNDGVPRVSAAMMESHRMALSAILNGTDIQNPSQLAYHLQGKRFSVLDGRGAADLARDLNIPRTDLLTEARIERWLKLREESHKTQPSSDRHGTIGAVAVDQNSHLCAVTSTGGVGNETVGRVGDTPTVAGTYCTESTAVSATGIGEQIVAISLSSRIAVRVQDGMSLEQAMNKTLNEAASRRFNLAAIALSVSRDRSTVEWAAGSTAPYFVWGSHTHEGTRTFMDYLKN